MRQLIPSNRGLKAILSINDKVLGGQINCLLNRSTKPIDITNKITGEWASSISGVNQWSLICSGLYIKDEESFDILERAFHTGSAIEVTLSDSIRTYKGKALIINFPLNLNYNDNFAYSLTLQGVGPLDDGKIY